MKLQKKKRPNQLNFQECTFFLKGSVSPKKKEKINSQFFALALNINKNIYYKAQIATMASKQNTSFCLYQGRHLRISTNV